MTKTLLSRAVLAALLAAGATAHAQQQQQGSTPVRTESGAPPPPGAQVIGQDLEFMLAAARLANAEIAAGQMALSRSSDPGVRALAQRLVADWSAARTQLQQIAQARGVALPADAPQALREEMNGLQGVPAQAFDRNFLQTIGNESHQQAIRMYQAQAERGQDPALKPFAVQGLAQLRQHLAMSLALQERAAAGAATRASGASGNGEASSQK